MSILKDPGLYSAGIEKMDWTFNYMPVLRNMSEKWKGSLPLDGIKITVSMRIDPKFGNFVRMLKYAGAQVTVSASSTNNVNDEVAAGLYKEGIQVFAKNDIDAKTYKKFLMKSLESRPNIVIDTNGDLVTLLHNECNLSADEMIGGLERTVMGIRKVRAREKAEKLNFPVIASNNAKSQMLFNERYGTGQSVWSSIISTTNVMLAGKNVVVAGYGWTGRGVALRAIGLGANVIVCEIDPVKALEAAMDGCNVMVMEKAAKLGDIFITTTGCKDVIRGKHFSMMKDGALLTNAGHFNVEINVNELEELSFSKEEVNQKLFRYTLKDGRKINLIGEGRLVNLVVDEASGTEAMDLGYAVLVKCAIYLVENHSILQKQVYDIPEEIDTDVAHIKLNSRNIVIDKLTDDQSSYLRSWEVK